MQFFKNLFSKKKSETTAHEEIVHEEKVHEEKDDVLIFDANEDGNLKIELCLSEDDYSLFESRKLKAICQGKPTFTFPKDKWLKAVSERQRRDEQEAIISKTAELNNRGIAFEEEGDIASAIKVYEENVALGYPARHSYERLMVLYRKQEDRENELRIIKLTLEKFPNDTKTQKRLAIMLGTYETKTIKSAPRQKKVRKCWGDIWEKRILEVPEFDFYCERETNPQKYDNGTLYYDYLKPIWEVQTHFSTLLSEAKKAEDLGDQERAVQLYEQAVAEKYYMPTPYDRLIKIYSKAKLRNEEKRILQIGVKHFSDLREKRREYVLMLAKKYGALDFALDRIKNGKKITYYNGVFELYNPYPIVERWQERMVNKDYF